MCEASLYDGCEKDDPGGRGSGESKAPGERQGRLQQDQSQDTGREHRGAAPTSSDEDTDEDDGAHDRGAQHAGLGADEERVVGHCEQTDQHAQRETQTGERGQSHGQTHDDRDIAATHRDEVRQTTGPHGGRELLR